MLIPFIQLYALYVIAHGDISPGGGFQGGVILGASIILYSIIYGVKEGRSRMRQTFNDNMNSIGVLIFVAIGLLCVLGGGMFLQYASISHHYHALANHLGIYGIEIGVGITVAGVMMTIFFETASKDDD